MDVYWNLNSVKREPRAALTVGTFDGVHLGHQYVIGELCKRARENKVLSTLVTFTPHPKIVLTSAKKTDIKVLTSIEEKIKLFKKSGLDRIVVINFNDKFATITADEFVKECLYKTIGFSEIIVGYDHSFGKNREGSKETLQALANLLDFKVTELQELNNAAGRLSSTSIRHLLSNGAVESAAKALGRNYSLAGVVVSGAGRGKELGFPTANIKKNEPSKLVPAAGVYAVYAQLGSQKFKGMMNIGARPTFEKKTRQIMEIHFFDFNNTIYGANLIVEFVQRLRDEIEFPNTEALVEQLNCDKIRSYSILNQETC